MDEMTDERLDEIVAQANTFGGVDVGDYVNELVAEVRRLKALDIDTAFCWHCKHVTSEFAFVCPECMDLVKRLEAEKVRARELYENAARDTLAFTAAIDPDGPTVEDVMKAYDEALRKERV